LLSWPVGAPGRPASASRVATRASISSSTRSRKVATTASLYSGPSSSWAAAAARISAMTWRLAAAYGSPVRTIRSRAAALILSCDIAFPRPVASARRSPPSVVAMKASYVVHARAVPLLSSGAATGAGPSQLGSGRRSCLSSGYNAGTGAGRDQRPEDVQHRRIRHAAPVRGEQAPRFGVAPAGPVLA